METFSLARAIPGMRPGARARNAALVLVAPAVVFVWPFVAAYAVGTDRGGCGGAFAWVPGIERGGGGLPAAAAFAWTAVALALAFAPLAVVAPAVVRQWVTLALPALYLLAIGFAAARTAALFGAWWALRGSGTGAIDPGPVQLTGTAAAVDETLETPVSGTEALAYVGARFQYTQAVSPGTINESTWELVDRETAAVPFAVEAGDERALVDATADALAIEGTRTAISDDRTTTPTEPLPDEIPAETVGAEAGDGSGPSGFAEQRIEPGDRVTVSGIAVPGEEYGEREQAHRTVITDAERAPPRLRAGETPFVVTDEAHNAAGTDRLRRAVSMLVLTVLLIVPLLVSPLPSRLAALLGL